MMQVAIKARGNTAQQKLAARADLQVFGAARDQAI
jgi:hypothetical protein